MFLLIFYNMCAPAHATHTGSFLSPQLRATLYSLQYTLATHPSSFTTTLDAIDMFLGIYATQHTFTDDSRLFISTERRKIENTSYLWQEIAITFSSLEKFQDFITALQTLSPQILIKKSHTSCIIYINNIPTHKIHAHIAQPSSFLPYSYLTIIIDDVGENYSLLKQFTKLQMQLTFAVWPFASATPSSVKYLQSLQLGTYRISSC